MKSLLIAVLTLISLSSFAGTGVVYRNEPLGFTMYESSSTEDISICDSTDNCFYFSPVKTAAGTTTYKEASNRCQIEVTYFSKDFAQGKTENDFMLSVGFQVIQVVEGESRCILMQNQAQARSLTGIYN